MNLSAELHEELTDLLEMLCRGTIDQNQLERLQAIVLESPAGRDLYLESMRIHRGLEWLFRETTRGEVPSPELATPLPGYADPTSIHRTKPTPVLGFLANVSRYVPGGEFTVGTLILLVVGAAFWGLSQALLFPRLGGPDQELAVESPRHQHVVAEILNAADVAWANKANRLTAPSTNRASITHGEPLEINSGVVELRLKRGATLIVEGPAEWRIDGENAATLTRGKLIANVPQQAVGFTLETPSATIVDLGTEFGVKVDGDGRTASHVFRGRVRVLGVLPDQGPSSPRSVVVEEGQSVVIAAAGDSPAAPQPTPDTVREQFSRQRRVSSETHDIAIPTEVARHKPVIYLPMECDKLSRFTDLVSGRPLGFFDTRRSRAQFLVPGVTGHAIRFVGKDSTDCLWIDPSQDAAACDFSRGEQPGLPFTIVLWFKEIQFSNGLRALCCKGPDHQMQYLLDAYLGQFRFIVADHRGKHTVLLTPNRTGKLREWQHVAAVFDPRQTGHMKLYLNGLEVGAVPLQDNSLQATSAPLQIGNRGENGVGSFAIDAIFDEFAILPCALDAQQVAAMWKAYEFRDR